MSLPARIDPAAPEAPAPAAGPEAPAVPPAPETFADLLARSSGVLFSTEDLLAACTPLLRQVLETHARGLVAPLAGIDDLRVTNGHIWFENARASPVKTAPERVATLLQQGRGGAIEVVAHYRRTEDDAGSSVQDLRVGELGTTLTRPLYLPGFLSWEHEVEHHDPVTDVYVLGLIMGSLATGLNLGLDEDLRRFVACRENLQRLNPALHPVAALVIARMTELDRHKRQQDLAQAIDALERRRDQDALRAFDLTQFRGFVASAASDRRHSILGHLQTRLFDRSRRNRLLYFRPTAASLNLTVSSVPPVLDVKSIDPDNLATWRGAFAEQILSQKAIGLSRWLRFEDYPFIAPSLDKVRLDATHDAAEYGASQLRLVVAFLHWHDLKNAPEERISSPLLLLPVRLQKRKGVRDAYTLEASAELAEVNPVLRHHLKQLFGISLPQSVDLSVPTALDELHRALAQQITATEPGVVLEKLERPRIDLVQAIARRRLEAHQRRTRLSGRGVRSLHGFDYSYARDRRAPLGIQLFTHVVMPSEAPQRSLLEDPKPRIFRLGPEVREVEKQQYTLLDGAAGSSPYRWAVDLCSVTIANFNYRKMSLVGDYGAMLKDERPSKVFDTLFPKEARPLAPEVPRLPLQERYAVVDGDPTQLHALALARSGASFIIQGPPGTGKSQTIANLIADFLARGKRILFVCEKRAALDVVYHRLQQQGLGRLCCVIHDSQEDKKSFVMALKESYESWIGGAADPAIQAARETALKAVTDEQQGPAQFVREMSAHASGSDRPLVQLMRRCVALGPAPELPEDAWALIPEHRTYEAHAELLQRICDGLARTGAEGVLARHPARLLRGTPLDGPQALDRLREQLRDVRGLVSSIADDPQERVSALALTSERADFARLVLPLAQARLLQLLDARGELTERLRSGVTELQRRLEVVAATTAESNGWRTPLPRADAEAALALSEGFERTFFRFLYPTFWRIRRLLRERFDFASRLVPPTFVQILKTLLARYTAEAAAGDTQRQLTEVAGTADALALFELAGDLRQRELSTNVRAFRDALAVGNEADTARVEALARFAEASGRFDAVLAGWRRLPAPELLQELDRIERGFDRLPDLLPILRLAETLPESFSGAVRWIDLQPRGFEAAVSYKAVRASPGVRRGGLDGAALETASVALADRSVALRKANAAAVIETTRGRFLTNVGISGAPVAGLDVEQKALKKIYAAGRRDLEHEFGKVMRFRPIRDLVSGPPGVVVRDLRPVWLMSPLSVADTLPLAAEFDVVLVDEASQIPLEDALPALERGRQVVIVGDEKQLPPTAFFASRNEEDVDADADVAGIDADSLLDHAALALPATMLGWHYRSRDEVLISFCNQAFYEGRLLTAPSVNRLRPRPEIRAQAPADAVDGARALLERPLSFHRMHRGLYQQRCNTVEAEYTAGLVRTLLLEETGHSIGIVAFSEAQQDEIESALRRLGETDVAFRARYEAELERVEDGQFNGLFVKNLENVQGDERDIMILSICYGPDAQGRMAMNFGPINQRGGERRLNVIFSRARHHMAVVSSIDWSHITNDYNDGAACLKSYLRYAAAASRGDTADTVAVLDGLARSRGVPGKATPDPVATDLAQALRELGWEVDLNVGASRFQCDLAVRPKGQFRHQLGILIDNDAHYENPDLDDTYRLKPAVLRAFGWDVRWVLTRDWLLDRAGVIQRIEAALKSGAEAHAE